jgi:two-component system response regulator QseB
MTEILVLEDDPKLLELLGEYIVACDENYTPVLYSAIASAKKHIAQNNISMAIVDINLTDGIGFEFIKALRKDDISHGSNLTPIITITGIRESEIEVKSFETGSTIFHQKPINLKLLAAQIKSLCLNNGKILFKRSSLRIEMNRVECQLTQQEFNILSTLYRYYPRLVRREIVANKCNPRANSLTALDTAISRLRRKLDNAGIPIAIDTLYSIGYKISFLKDA